MQSFVPEQLLYFSDKISLSYLLCIQTYCRIFLVGYKILEICHVSFKAISIMQLRFPRPQSKKSLSRNRKKTLSMQLVSPDCFQSCLRGKSFWNLSTTNWSWREGWSACKKRTFSNRTWLWDRSTSTESTCRGIVLRLIKAFPCWINPAEKESRRLS